MNKEEILQKLDSGEIKLYGIEKNCDPNEAIVIRKEYIEKKLNFSLANIKEYPYDASKIYGRNCENVIGVATLPVGVAGPIKVLGEHAYGEYFVPIATTEGALVASVNRGAKTISDSGGAIVRSEYVGITRAPLYRLKNIAKAKEFIKWVTNNFEKIKEIGNSTDKFLNVTTFEPYSNGKNVWLRFSFNTGDAMGMNMAVIATKAMSEWMESNFEGVETLCISGNMCTDKKAASINVISGRGRMVEAEIVIPREIVERDLKTTVTKVIEVNHNKVWLGSQMAGSLGFNAHVANMIAGIFIATGQDPAHVVDASLTSTNMEAESNGDLYMHIRIPALNIATFGGGTSLATQSDYQKMIITNVSDNLKENTDPLSLGNINNTQKLAEIIGATLLAGELSLHAAFANNTFVKAHTDFGRNSKV